MKIQILVLFLIVIFFCNLNAKTSCYILGGKSYSSFRTTSSEKVTGYTWAIGGEWHLVKKFTIAMECFYDLRGGILYDKIVGGRDVKYVYIQDIHCLIRSINIPLFIKYTIPLKKNMRVKMFAGPSISIGYKDKSEIKNKRFLYEVKNPDDWENIYYDYGYNIDSSGPLPYIAKSSGLILNCGFGVEWSFLKLEYRYSHDFFKVNTIRSVNLNEKIHSFHILFGIVFDFQFSKDSPHF